MNANALLKILPPANGTEIILSDKQSVDDIVKEVLAAHKAFAKDYDLIAYMFGGTYALESLFDFCKGHLTNVTESEDEQTTVSPTVLLERGHCDCKGYAGFIGGVLDALNRSGDHYDWVYRFAEYDEPQLMGKPIIHHHVFIVVKDLEGEIWIDPVLTSFDQRDPEPDRHFDKKVSALTAMKISGVPMIGEDKALSRMGNPLGGYAVGGSAIGDTVLCDGFTYTDAQVADIIRLYGTMDAYCKIHGVSTPAQNAAALAKQKAALEASQVANAHRNLFDFKGAGTGLPLPSIDGYPPDLPQLQLSLDGRLCFFDWPTDLTDTFVWNTWINGKLGPIPGPVSNMDWNTYLQVFTSEPITQAEFNQLRADYAAGLEPHDLAVATGSPSNPYLKQGHPYMWLFINIQYYIDKYLKNPYPVNELIPYGTNWNDQFKAAMMDGPGKFKTYLEGCNFLVQPQGSKGFWDKFYLAAPTVIAAIAAIVTYGAATPYLIAAMAAFKAVTAAGEQSAANYAAHALPQQGTAVINTAAVQQDITTLQGEGSTGLLDNVMTWIKANPLPAAGISLLLVLIIYEASTD